MDRLFSLKSPQENIISSQGFSAKAQRVKAFLQDKAKQLSL
jgi:hypothetical protein